MDAPSPTPPPALPPAGPPARQQPPALPASPVRRLAAPLATLAAAVAAFAYVGAVDPNEPGHYPVCPLLATAGILCPGCGGLRSAHAVAHGDLVGALGANAMAVLGYAVFAVLMVVWITRAVQRKRVRFAPPPVLWWVVGGLLAVFSVVRNLPFGSALAP
ncbi:DUF2752 domain-containing protein [Streptomyces candidus]|uniref:Peptidoglycan/LPS O-acetylase OafA/YrhL n=1 Tax=Streptomyces candidus TaxID=67283 RepID=A0A7X0H9R2_9ACTN|nr:DUF2752 domain-containing protein [Streptomyces candidus]MBB6433683.1 peptidoglycan/LPS O-acetylase OafA/YrhL [Streptomyces candidus]